MSSRGALLRWIFKGGRAKDIISEVTAGNVVLNISPGAGYRWLLLYGQITLICDATAVVRTIRPRITTPLGGILAYLPMGANAAENTTNILSMHPTYEGVGIQAQINAHMGLGEIIINGTNRFTILINSGVAGDAYTVYLTVLEAEF